MLFFWAVLNEDFANDLEPAAPFCGIPNGGELPDQALEREERPSPLDPFRGVWDGGDELENPDPPYEDLELPKEGPAPLEGAPKDDFGFLKEVLSKELCLDMPGGGGGAWPMLLLCPLDMNALELLKEPGLVPLGGTFPKDDLDNG